MITQGVVKYMRRVNLGNYEHKEAAVELSFAEPNGEVTEALIDHVQALAVAKAEAMLIGQAVPFAPSTVAPAVAPAAPSVQKQAEDIAARYPNTLAELAKVNPADIVIGAKHPDPLAGLTQNSVPTPAPAAVAHAIDASTSPAAVEITDRQLVEALTSTNAKLLNSLPDAERAKVPVRITALVHEYVTPPGKVQSIPQDKRGHFLEKLAAL